MKFTQYLARAALVSAVTVVSVPAHASHSWSTYHWARTANPLPLQVVDSVSSDWQFEFETSLSEWNQSSVLDMSVSSADDSSRTRKRCSSVSGEMRVCNASYGYNGWLGLASINIDSNGHITRGTAKMNDSYSSYWTDPNEKRHVMCQEIGHVFGLAHTSEDGSSQGTCMDYSSSPGSISPNQHDYQELSSIYSHLDSYNSYAGGDSGGDSGCNAPPGKGCNKFGANFEGGPPMGLPVQVGLNFEIWVAADGKGGYWVHHVYVAPGVNDHRFKDHD